MRTLSQLLPIQSELETQTPSFFDTSQTPFADLLQRLTTLTPNTPLPTFTAYKNGELLHLLATCDPALHLSPNSLPLTTLASLPLTTQHSYGICNYCSSFIIGGTESRKAYLYGDQQVMGASARQLRAIYFASQYLTLALESQTQANARSGLLTRAAVTMSSLRARSSIFGWRNQLIQQINSEYNSDTAQGLLTKIDRELSKTDYTPTLPSGGVEIGMGILGGIKDPATENVEHFLITKYKFRKLHTPAMFNEVKKAASKAPTPTYAEFKKLLSSSPKHSSKTLNKLHSSLDPKSALNTWTLVYLPHIPEVPLAAAYLKHLIHRDSTNFLLSGFAVLPTPLAIALTYTARRFPKVERGVITDSTSKKAERVSYDLTRETIIPLQVLTFDDVDSSIDAQTLNLTLELWDSSAEMQGYQLGSYGWALMGADSYQLARTLK